MERSFNGFINNFAGFLRVFVYANFWVAGAVYALTRITEVLINAQQESLAVLNAAGTLVIYGFARYFEGPSQGNTTSKITAWRKSMPNLTKLSIVGGAAFAIVELVRIGSLGLFLHYLIGAAVALLYPLPWIMKNKGGGLRSIPGLKLFVIAFVWAFTTGFLPAIWNGHSGWWWLLERFLWTIALTIPFDVRDVKLDAQSIKTLPHVIGPRNSIYLAHACIWMSFSLMVLAFGLPLIITFLLYLFFAVVIIVARAELGDLYYSFFIEGLPWFLLGLVVLLPYL
jgi:4-hydroxybenzoate polyprenyltransferase